MKLKLDTNGNVVIGPNGGPMYVRDNGVEIEFDGAKAFDKITTLTAEATTSRQAKEAAEGAVNAAKAAGIDLTPEGLVAAKKAIDTTANLNSGQLLTAGKVEEMKAALTATIEAQNAEKITAAKTRIAELETSLNDTTGTLNTYMIGNHFKGSEFLKTKAKNTPLSLIESTFAPQFRVEAGKLVAYKDKAFTKRVFSNKNPGEDAEFEEAIEILVKDHPDRDHILSAPGGSGGGTGSSGRVKNGIDLSLSPEARINAARAQAGGH
jgi:hypothetical protein